MPTIKKIHIVTLGCARNQVDSEHMMGRLIRNNWAFVDNPAQAHVIVVNTCSFIEKATDESIDTILALAEFKQKGICRQLVVTGCLPERFREETHKALSEVDVFLGTGAYDQIVHAAENSFSKGACLLPDPDSIDVSVDEERPLAHATPSAYLKIAEGCNRNCTYCVIPKLRGRQKSRDAAHIVNEAEKMIRASVKELVLVAQESSHYGADRVLSGSDLSDLDLYGQGLSGLLYSLAQLSDRVWIRVLYGHPQSMTMDIIDTIAENTSLVPYFDLPIQHASDRILKKMGRRYTKEHLHDLFTQIRHRIPNAVLRTTIITGFPGETDQDFEELVAFIDQVRFDHLGVFVYSDAEDLKSHRLPNPVPEEIAQNRYDRLMSLQMGISTEKNQGYLGKILEVLVEESLEEGIWIGRVAGQAPDVDGVTYIRSKNGLEPIIGEFESVKVIDAMEYDLIAEMAG